MNASRDQNDVAKKMAAIICRLNQIEEKEKEVMEGLHMHFKGRVNDAAQKLGEHLRSPGVRAHFTKWTSDKVPKEEDSWEETKIIIVKAFETRLQEIIEHWEEDHQVFSNARQTLLELIQQRFNFVERQLQNIQVVVLDDDLNVPEIVPADEELPMLDKVVMFINNVVWIKIPGLFKRLDVRVVGTLLKKAEDAFRNMKYQRNKLASMASLSALYLNEVTAESVLDTIVNDRLREVERYLKKIEDFIPEMIEADKMLCRQLADETRSQKERKDLYQPIMDEAFTIRGHLAVFAFQETGAADISCEELDWKEDMPSRLGCGAFSTVFQGKMKRQGKPQTVALKVCSEVLDFQNASLIMAEVELLR